MSWSALVKGCLLSALVGTGCAGIGESDPSPTGSKSDPANTTFAADPDDEVIDPSDPPTDPDPIGAEEVAASVAEALTGTTTFDVIKAACPKRSSTLSPKGLTFVIHISKTFEGEAFSQLASMKKLIRPRDLFMVEEKSPVLHQLRVAFPCNDIHFIAYPDQFEDAIAAADVIDGISIDWETGVANHPQSWTVNALSNYSDRIRAHNLRPSSVPAWPNSFNDGHITRASKMDYELSQLQSRCAHAGADAFADGARASVKNFQANGLTPHDIGFEISLDSYDFADNHTDVEQSADCTRKAYGKGARAIYLYGNGQPQLHDYFKRIETMGLRTAN